MHANPLAEPATLLGGIYWMEKHIEQTAELARMWLRSQILLCSGASRAVHLDL
jgi:hypothetical protein